MPLSPSKSKICFFFQDTAFSLPRRTELKHFIEALFRKEGKKLGSLNYIFCTDEVLLDINRRYLKHDYYTDIITFALSDDNAPIQGEVYISIDRVRENALSLGNTIKSELHRVIFHGALHLCGFKDKTIRDRTVMRKKEDILIGQYLSARST